MQEFFLDQILLDDEAYISTKANLFAYLDEDFSRRKEIVVVYIEDTRLEMKISKLVINLIVLEPFNIFKRKLDLNFLFNNDFDTTSISLYFNRLIDEFSEEDYGKLSTTISSIIENLSDLSGESNVKIGNTISLYSIIKLAERNPEVLELINTEIPAGLQFDEIEDLLKNRSSRLIEILSEEDTCFKDYFNAKTGIDKKQFGQVMVNVGLKPDLFGNVISDPIDTNYVRGLRDTNDFYINALGGRKALITTHKRVKDSGYLTRKLSLLLIDTRLDSNIDDCGSGVYVPCNVFNEGVFKRIIGRWYLNEEFNELYCIHENHEFDLVGKTILLRSPMTCCSENGKVCRTCYGDNLSKLNHQMHIGIVAVLLLTNQLTQRLLSSKHLLQTSSTKINWDPKFLETFSVERNMVLLASLDGFIVINTEDWEEDEEEGIFTINEFQIKQGKESFPIKTEIPLIVGDELKDAVLEYKENNGIAVVPIKILNPEGSVFTLVMENNELSASLQNILDLVESTSHLGIDDPVMIYNKFSELLEESSIQLNLVHAELILRCLIRDPNDLTHRPDFTTGEWPESVVLRVTEALLKSPSVAISLAFERVKKQFTSPETYEKDLDSVMDVFF
jgi:hypothetical protein